MHVCVSTCVNECVRTCMCVCVRACVCVCMCPPTRNDTSASYNYRAVRDDKKTNLLPCRGDRSLTRGHTSSLGSYILKHEDDKCMKMDVNVSYTLSFYIHVTDKSLHFHPWLTCPIKHHLESTMYTSTYTYTCT